MEIIDTHAHFWSTQKFHYPWIEKGSLFDRDFLLPAYQKATKTIDVTKMIFVECDSHPRHKLDEVAWVETLAKQEARIQGIVAHLELTDTKNFNADLRQLLQRPMVKGVRHNIQGQAEGFALQRSFVNGVQEIHKQGLHFELCLTHDQLAEVTGLVGECQQGHFVLDHCAKPGIRSGSREPWVGEMKRLASYENVVCKISGLLTEDNWDNRSDEGILFYAEYAAEVFGHSRLLFGSDWPVCEAAGGYQRWYQLTQRLTASWTTAAKGQFYYDNAHSFYRL